LFRNVKKFIIIRILSISSKHKKTQRGFMKEKQDLFLKEFSNSFNISEACRQAGVSRRTFYDWHRDNKEFSQIVVAIEQGFVDAAESVLFDTILNGYKTDKNGETITVAGKKQRSKEALDAAKFVLARKGKDRGYVEQVDINADIKATKMKLAAKEVVIDVTPEQIKRKFLERVNK
jgi:hypothetical protein